MAIFRWLSQDKCIFQLPSPSLLSNLWHDGVWNAFSKRVGTRSDQSSQAKCRRLISYIDFDKLYWRFPLRAATGASCVASQPRQETDQEEGRPLRWLFYGGLSFSFFVCEAFRRATSKQTHTHEHTHTHTQMCERSKEWVWKTLKGWFPQNYKSH